MLKTNKGKKKTVFVGLSGGVDSAVSAALLQSHGYEVVGVFIRIVLPGYPCSADIDKLDAMRVAAHLRIPFLELDLSEEYEKDVFKSSIDAFKKGQTPNPDVLCNREIKFGKLYTFAKSQGADFVATGHYAQLVTHKLLMGVDQNKDQSYFLWMVPHKILEDILFPVGAMHKEEVRALAKKFNLPNATRHDSQGLCFLGDISIETMLKKELTFLPGNVLSESGEIIGKHDGAALYTLGERHGFLLFSHSPTTKPHFIIGKNIKENTVTVSEERYPIGVKKTKIVLRDSNWIGTVPTGICEARFRYRQTLIPAEIFLQKNKITVILQNPYYVPLGQSLVLYRDTVCLGGGIVESTEVY